MSAETFPTGPAPVDELERLARDFPERDARGYVMGHYVYRRGVNAGREAGPFPSRQAAIAARDGIRSLDSLDVIYGHVFTSRGMILRAPLAPDASPRDRIAAILERHGSGPAGCMCGGAPDVFYDRELRAHIADVIAAELRGVTL